MTTRFALSALLALAACAAPPTVAYRPLAASPPGDGVPYQLTDTLVVIGVVPDKDATTAAGAPPVRLDPGEVECDPGGCATRDAKGRRVPVQIAAVAIPIAFAGEIMTITPQRRGLTTTTIAPVYFSNSLRLLALSVEAKDHRLEIINAVGSIAKTVVGFGIGGGARSNDEAMVTSVRLTLPILLDMADIKAAESAGSIPLPDPNGGNWTLAASLGPNPTALGLLPRARAAEVRHGIVTSACRPLRLTVGSGGGIGFSLAATVADPDWLIAVPFPTKGSMLFHTLCGADVKADPVAEIGVDKLAEAFATNVASIRAAAK